MERTKEYSVVNDTLKALKNQGLSERYFQKGHSFSSAPRYDRFDTSPNEWLTEDSTVRHSISISYLVDFARCFREKS